MPPAGRANAPHCRPSTRSHPQTTGYQPRSGPAFPPAQANTPQSAPTARPSASVCSKPVSFNDLDDVDAPASPRSRYAAGRSPEAGRVVFTMTIMTIGLDLGTRVFQAHGADEHGAAVLAQRLARQPMITFFSKLSP